MLTKVNAIDQVSKRLHELSSIADPFVLIEVSTIERPFGWVFFYNSKNFLTTGIARYRLAGNGPVIFNKFSGAMEFHGSDKALDELITDYEKRLALDSL